MSNFTQQMLHEIETDFFESKECAFKRQGYYRASIKNLLDEVANPHTFLFNVKAFHEENGVPSTNLEKLMAVVKLMSESEELSEFGQKIIGDYANLIHHAEIEKTMEMEMEEMRTDYDEDWILNDDWINHDWAFRQICVDEPTISEAAAHEAIVMVMNHVRPKMDKMTEDLALFGVDIANGNLYETMSHLDHLEEEDLECIKSIIGGITDIRSARRRMHFIADWGNLPVVDTWELTRSRLEENLDIFIEIAEEVFSRASDELARRKDHHLYMGAMSDFMHFFIEDFHSAVHDLKEDGCPQDDPCFLAACDVHAHKMNEVSQFVRWSQVQRAHSV